MTQPLQAPDVFTREERRIIQRHRTPEQVQQFLRRLPYNWELHGETLRSFRQVVRLNTAHCLEAALVAAVILEQHGYPPLVVSFESKDGVDHVIFVFRHEGRWGSVARSRDAGLHGRKPVFRGIRDLVWSYFDPYVDSTGRITGYQLADLRALGPWASTTGAWPSRTCGRSRTISSRFPTANCRRQIAATCACSRGFAHTVSDIAAARSWTSTATVNAGCSGRQFCAPTDSVKGLTRGFLS